MPRPRIDSEKVTLYLFKGDFKKLIDLSAGYSASEIARNLIRRYLNEVEGKRGRVEIEVENLEI